MKGSILTAGLNTRLRDLSDKHNKTSLDLGSETLLGNLLHQFARAGVHETYVLVGFDALSVRTQYGTRATCLLNPFFDCFGILGRATSVREDRVGGEW